MPRPAIPRRCRRRPAEVSTWPFRDASWGAAYVSLGVKDILVLYTDGASFEAHHTIVAGSSARRR